MTLFRAPTGTRDILGLEGARFASLVGRFARRARLNGFDLLVSPMFEDVAVFRRSAGEESDVVKDEMYEFLDKGGRALALRPEGTASVVRGYLQNRPQLPWKAWYLTPAFRYERPQAGRYRQHHQLGAELLGTADPDADVEIITFLLGFLDDVGLRRIELKVNSMGDQACMPSYRERLVAYLSSHEDELCEEHRARWRRNPLRVLDCKKASCAGLRGEAPRLVDFLCEPCAAHYRAVLERLDALRIPWRQDDTLVRGFDYYTRTTFEVASLALDAAQNAVGGGGRYDGLAEQLGGPPTPGVGFGSGIERVLLAAKAEGALEDVTDAVEVFVIDLVGGGAAWELTAMLRGAGLVTERAFDGRSLKAQLKAADRRGARLACIVGPAEREAGTVTVRVLAGPRSAHQESVDKEELVVVCRALLEKAGALAQPAQTQR
jgi:histidyl-tRNA synthetase